MTGRELLKALADSGTGAEKLELINGFLLDNKGASAEHTLVFITGHNDIPEGTKKKATELVLGVNEEKAAEDDALKPPALREEKKAEPEGDRTRDQAAGAETVPGIARPFSPADEPEESAHSHRGKGRK